jgi:hypothetical protein
VACCCHYRQLPAPQPSCCCHCYRLHVPHPSSTRPL